MTAKNNFSEVACPLCLEEASYRYDKKSYKFYLCRGCRLLFIHPKPSTDDVYDKSYFSGAERGFGYVDYDADKEPMRETFEKYLDLLSGYGLSSGRLLDVGAATGFFMDIASNRGFDPVGLEVSSFAASKGREKGLIIFEKEEELDSFSDSHFDVITMFDVLEHLPEPTVTLLRLSRLLKPGGMLVINTPDAESLWAKATGKYWQLILPPEHIHYFSPGNLSAYLVEQGFIVRDKRKIGKKFTIQYILKMFRSWIPALRKIFSDRMFGKLGTLSMTINLRDNFFMIAEKQNSNEQYK